MTIFELTKKRGGAGQRVIHAYQGGGPGMPGLYVKGITWCGVERRSGMFLADTDRKPTCGACKRRIAAHEAKYER